MFRKRHEIILLLNYRMLPDHLFATEDRLRNIVQERIPRCGVTGSGVVQNAEGEPQSCDLQLEVEGNIDQTLAALIEIMRSWGAPRGSSAVVRDSKGNETDTPVPFGVTDGLALYLKARGLPDEVYETNSTDDLIDLLSQHLEGEGEGRIVSYWEGPDETALYLYGPSATRMRELIADVLNSHPLAQGCRIADIT